MKESEKKWMVVQKLLAWFVEDVTYRFLETLKVVIDEPELVEVVFTNEAHQCEVFVHL